MTKRLLPLIAAAMLTACVSAGGPQFVPAPKPTSNDALVYIYRPDAMFYSGIRSHFYLDGARVASLNKNGYSAFYVPAGSYTLKQNWPGMDNEKQRITAPIEFKPGEVSYYRLTIGLKDFGMGPGVWASATHEWAITKVPESEAEGEIMRTHYQPPADAPMIRAAGAEQAASLTRP